jgi:uncharacterized membrane protein YsdA (DUF1294 family)
VTAILIYLLLVNTAAYLIFAWDKQSARHNLRRVPERHLLFFAAIGGSIGLIAAQKLHRHKTQKEPFRTYLRLIAGTQAFLLLGVFFWWLHNLLS